MQMALHAASTHEDCLVAIPHCVGELDENGGNGECPNKMVFKNICKCVELALPMFTVPLCNNPHICVIYVYPLSKIIDAYTS